jgi:hypothetical protein
MEYKGSLRLPLLPLIKQASVLYAKRAKVISWAYEANPLSPKFVIITFKNYFN